MARVTKLPIETLREKAKATPVFAPGLENLLRPALSPRSGTLPDRFRIN